MDPNRSIVPIAEPDSVLPADAVAFVGCAPVVRMLPPATRQPTD